MPCYKARRKKKNSPTQDHCSWQESQFFFVVRSPSSIVIFSAFFPHSFLLLFWSWVLHRARLSAGLWELPSFWISIRNVWCNNFKLNIKSSNTELLILNSYVKGGLIWEMFALWLKSPKKGAKNYSEHYPTTL